MALEAPEQPPEPSGRAKLAFALAAAVVGLYVAFKIQDVFFVVITGVLVAIVIDALARQGTRFLKLSRTPAVIIAAVIALAATTTTVVLIAVPLVKQGSAFAEALPEKTEVWRKRLEETRKQYPILAGVVPAMDGKIESHGATAQEAKDTVKGAALFASRLLEGVITFVSIFFLAIFLAMDPERYVEGLARLLPGQPFEERCDLLYRIGESLRNYLVAMGIYMVAMAALWALGLWLIGIDYYLLFGVIGGVVEIVPYVGPMVGLVPPLFVAMGMGSTKVLLVLGLYVVLHVVEGYLLIPLLMEKREKLPPPITLVAILAFGAAFGFWGVLLAVPLGTAAYVWVTHSILGMTEAEDEEPAEAPAPEALKPGLAGGV